jgi:hypothetical protein
MSIFKTEVAPGIVLSSDSVVSATIDHSAAQHLPGLQKSSELSVQNTQRGAVRRKSGEQ